MPKPKTIIWFVYQFESPGGGERWILEAEKVLSRKGVKTHIICVAYDEKVLFNHSYSVIVKILQKGAPKLGGFLQKSIRFLSMVKALRSEIKLINPDMVMNQGLREYVITYLATRFTRTKYSNMDFGQLYQIEGINIIYSYFYRPHLKKISEWMHTKGENLNSTLQSMTLKQRIQNEAKGLLLYLSYRSSAQIFTLSEKVKREAKLLYGRDAVVLKGAYDESLLAVNQSIGSLPSPGSKAIILTVGRLVFHKRVDLMIRALSLLRGQYPNFRFLIGGSGPEMERLKSLTQELKLDDHVEFLGYIEESLLMSYYRSCDVFSVMDPADYDITPMVALALGKRVVCPAIMEFDYAIESSGALFRTAPEPKKIALALQDALNSNSSKSIPQMPEMYQNYTWESCFTKMYNAWIETT
jgi:glycosyltransferase involved in cell wall biosynthesis